MLTKTDETLVKFVKENLNAVGFMDKSIGAFGNRVGESVMELINVFAKQEHTAFTYKLVTALFLRLVEGKPLDKSFCKAKAEQLLQFAKEYGGVQREY